MVSNSSYAMNRILRRLTWGVVGLVLSLALILVTVVSSEFYTMRRRHEEFVRRTAPIREGMTEIEVRAVAGAPDEFVTGIGSTTDRHAPAASCRETNGTAAMLYVFEICGWTCEHLGRQSSGIFTEVVCLDDRRIVLNRHQKRLYF